jgi:hypothetical protein
MAKVALLIGVSEYEVGLNPLPAAVKDVVALERILKDSEMGDFDEVKVLTNPEPQVMQYEVETLFSGRSKDDFVLLFFSGHGIKDDNNNLYFATRITKKSAKGDLIRSTAVPARFVHEVMNNSRAKRQAIILDCCFSGAFDPTLQSKGDDGSVDLQGQLGSEGRVVLTSSSSTQYSFEQQGSDLSLYTRYLIEGIETGAGDRDEDGKISVRELHEYAASKVHETAPNMTPKLIILKEFTGLDIVLAKAKVTDPKLRYRRLVAKYSSRGSISSAGRMILDTQQNQLNLSLEVAKQIETEVLQPFQERLKNLQRYKDEFSKAIKNQYPLNVDSQSELQDLLEIWGLRREDVAEIEKEVLDRSKQDSKVRQDNQQVLQSEEETGQADNLKELEDKMVRELLSRSSKERSKKKKVLFYLLIILTIVTTLLINYVLFGGQRIASISDDVAKMTKSPVADALRPVAMVKPYSYTSNQLFIIRLSSDETLSESENEVSRIQPLALRNKLTVQRFKINGWFVTTVGSFSSVQEANNFRDTILSEIEHFRTTGITVENIKDLCPNPVKVDKYWECVKK